MPPRMGRKTAKNYGMADAKCGRTKLSHSGFLRKFELSYFLPVECYSFYVQGYNNAVAEEIALIRQQAEQIAVELRSRILLLTS